MADYDETMASAAAKLEEIIDSFKEVKTMAEELEDELPAGDESLDDAQQLAGYADDMIENISTMKGVLEGDEVEDDEDEPDN